MKPVYLAIDIGASSGRHIVGWEDNGRMQTEEVYRFPNGVVRQDGHLIWDIEAIFQHVKEGIRAAFARYPHITSLSIDTWAVDYVLLKGDEPILPCYAYRDDRTQPFIEQVHQRLPFETLYQRTGIQFQPFNTIYQLCADAAAGRLQQADDFLMVPEYLLYRLCGVKAREYTNATTTGLVNANAREYDPEILSALSLPLSLFPKLTAPGTVLGMLKPEIAQFVGGQTNVVLCATHDTASAVEGIPMPENAPFLSSGTWSLLGVKLPSPITTEDSRRYNFTNEGGVGYIRYLKNIMGLWIIQCVQKQLNLSFPEMVQMARQSTATALFDVNDPRFVAPEDMMAEIRACLAQPDLSDSDLIRTVFLSLAHSYGQAIKQLSDVTGHHWDTLYIAGGGAKNQLLNEMTEQSTGMKVIALPIEATALGNLAVQAKIKD